MDFSGLTDTPEQAELRTAVRGFLASAPENPWKRLTGELGLTALAVPESLGGADATLAEVMVAVEETGRVLAPVPYLPTALAAAILAEAGVEDFVPGLADGTLTAALALGPGVTTFSGDADGGKLSGTVRNVLDGPEADVFLVRVAGALVAVRAADAAVTPVETLDQTRGQALVRFTGAPAVRVGDGDFADRAEGLLWTALAAESAAAAAQCLSRCVEYLKTRVQFGRPIGEFQALKHRCADLAAELESAWMTAHAAVRAALSDPEEFAIAAPLAKRYCADAFFRAAAEMIQLHGGIGFTWEHDAHRYLKRAKSTQLLHGTPAELRTLIARRAGLLPA
ncbi:MAG: acyl-CoA/acyl-ACP dehydrogenase [Streptosporangiales bacterium]|nr:acyl-CoA/acyl-ACP dehydrogenase [Streptosporangiales bacterium]